MIKKTDFNALTIEDLKGMAFPSVQASVKKMTQEKRDSLISDFMVEYESLNKKTTNYYDCPPGGDSISVTEFNKLMNRIKKLEILMQYCYLGSTKI